MRPIDPSDQGARRESDGGYHKARGFSVVGRAWADYRLGVDLAGGSEGSSGRGKVGVGIAFIPVLWGTVVCSVGSRRGFCAVSCRNRT